MSSVIPFGSHVIVLDDEKPPSQAEMFERRASISKEERCLECSGLGWIKIGYSRKRKVMLFGKCHICNGTGRKQP